jgi:hypothetical protein
LEPQIGSYNEVALDDLIRVCQFAGQHNLKVDINFYTMMSNDSWTMPDWLTPKKFEAVFINTTAKTAWLNFLNYCAFRLNGSETICSWHMMNEPARKSWACNVSVDDFLQLWTEMKAVFKAYSDRPVTVRFAAQVFENPEHFNCDPRIYSAFDFLALNWYENYCSTESLAHVVSDAQQHNCNVVLSEFGSNATTDAAQTHDYQRYLALFRTLGLRECSAWMWRADYDKGEPDLPGVNYNLARDVDGTPRPAFLLLKSTTAKNPYLVVRGIDNAIYYRLYDSYLGCWGSWSVLPSGSTYSGPAAVVCQGKLYICVQGVDGFSLWLSSLNLVDQSFSDWTLLDGVVQSAPTLVANGTHLFLLARGYDQALYLQTYDCQMDSWSGWQILLALTVDCIGAAVLDGTLHLVVHGLTDSTVLWHGYLNLTDGAFFGWTSIAGASSMSPALSASRSLDCLVLSVKGLDGVIYVNRWVAGVWVGWSALPVGSTMDGPATAVTGEVLQVVVRGLDGCSLWHCNYNLVFSTQSSWLLLDGVVSTLPRMTN